MNATRCLCLASALGVVLAASPMSSIFVSAQSARGDKVRPALLVLQREFAEPLIEITPALLHLQEELVENLRLQSDGMREEARAGQRPMSDVSDVDQTYYRELETLRVMTARLNNKSISQKELLKIRIAVRSDALAKLQGDSEIMQDRHNVGEVTQADVRAIKAKVLKAQIMLEALKQASGK